MRNHTKNSNQSEARAALPELKITAHSLDVTRPWEFILTTSVGAYHVTTTGEEGYRSSVPKFVARCRKVAADQGIPLVAINRETRSMLVVRVDGYDDLYRAVTHAREVVRDHFPGSRWGFMRAERRPKGEYLVRFSRP